MQRDPFATTPDVTAYVARPATEAALRELEAGLARGDAPVLLSGPSGIGKTLLMHLVAQRLAGHFAAVHIPFPALPPDEFFRWVVESPPTEILRLGASSQDDEATPYEARFSDLAERARASGRPMLLLVDDAETMPLETARELVERAVGVDALIGVLFVVTEDAARADAGVRDVSDSLEEAEEAPQDLRDLLGPDAVVVRFDSPMDPAECAAYLEARLEGSEEELRAHFDERAVDLLVSHSEGFPSRLHALADVFVRPDEAVPSHELARELRPDVFAASRAAQAVATTERVSEWSDRDLAEAMSQRGRRAPLAAPSDKPAQEPELSVAVGAQGALGARVEKSQAALGSTLQQAVSSLSRNSLYGIAGILALLFLGAALWAFSGGEEQAPPASIRLPSQALPRADAPSPGLEQAASPATAEKVAVSGAVGDLKSRQDARTRAAQEATESAARRVAPQVQAREDERKSESAAAGVPVERLPEFVPRKVAAPTPPLVQAAAAELPADSAEATGLSDTVAPKELAIAGRRPPPEIAAPQVDEVLLPVTIRARVGAEIWVDGVERGRAPLIGTLLSPGPHRVEARAAGSVHSEEFVVDETALELRLPGS